MTVCEVLGDLPAHEGKESRCSGGARFARTAVGSASRVGDPAGSTPLLWLTEDAVGAPKPPGHFELDAVALNHKFADILKHTALGKFRFGTSDYDRWAVVYGRVVARKGEDAKKAPADLIFRGSGVVIFLTTEH